jgi:hypothetical protein
VRIRLSAASWLDTAAISEMNSTPVAAITSSRPKPARL